MSTPVDPKGTSSQSKQPKSRKFRFGKYKLTDKLAAKLAAKSSAISASEKDTATLTNQDRFESWQQKIVSKYWRFAISALCTTVAASAVGLNLGLVNLWERQVQSLFFELRGPVTAPDNIVILTIDAESLSQGQHYLAEDGRAHV